MRGGIHEALYGTVTKLSPLANPKDRFVLDIKASRPQAYVAQSTNFAYENHKRREFETVIDQTPQFPTIQPDFYKPKIMENNGIATLPNAGIFRQQDNMIILTGR